jgi:hypothetical protein
VAAVAELFTLKTISGVRDNFRKIKYVHVFAFDIIIMEKMGTVIKTDVESECDKPGDILSVFTYFILLLLFL